MSSLHNNSKAFGLDISDLTIRAIQFTGQGRTLSIEAYNQTPVPAGLMKYGEILEPRAVSEVIKKLIAGPKKGRFTTKRVFASLPEWKSFVKIIEIPQVDNSQMAETIRWEAAQHIPYAIDDMYLDWRVLESNQTANTHRVLIGAIPKTVADAYTAVLEDADLKPIGLIIEPMAITYALAPQKTEKDFSALVLDIGLHRTSSIIVDRGVVTYSSSTKDISGYAMTELIAKKLKITDQEAEDAKRLCGLDPTRGKAVIPNTLLPYLSKIQKHIATILSFYKTHNTLGSDIQQIVLVGGGANLKNVDIVLSQRLSKKVSLGNPWQRAESLRKTNIVSPSQAASHCTAIGLGLIGISESYSK
ncbi:MAG: type IV pilus assembly protein PilM [Patescibacteria group bacterium]